MYCPSCGEQIKPASEFCTQCGYEISNNVVLPGNLQQSDRLHAIEYAGFWKRFAAYIIDFIIIGFVVTIIAFGVGFIVGFALAFEGRTDEEIGVVGMLIGMVIGLVLPWLYWSGMESSPNRATLGKMALNIVVTDTDGNRLTFWHATARYWAKIISTVILFIGYIMIAFTREKQGLHDIMTNCLVVVER